MAASFYWNDSTMDTNATRGGVPGDPFNTGPLRFYNDRTLQYQAPRMGNLYGTLGMTNDDFNVVTLPSGLTQAVATTDTARFRFQDLQRALNAAAKALGLPGRVKVSGTIDPPTAELALTVVQKVPAYTLAAHPTLMSLARLLAASPAVALTGAPRFMALSAESMAAGFASIQSIKVRISPVLLVATVVIISGTAGLIWRARRS